MSSRTCPDWPRLMEIAPDLQFKHYTVAEARLPGDALALVKDVSLSDAKGHLYHWLDDALRFVVYPADGGRGLVRLEGRWSMEEIDRSAEIVGT